MKIYSYRSSDLPQLPNSNPLSGRSPPQLLKPALNPDHKSPEIWMFWTGRESRWKKKLLWQVWIVGTLLELTSTSSWTFYSFYSNSNAHQSEKHDKMKHKQYAAWGSAGKESACNAGDTSSIPQSGRSPGGRNGNPFQYHWLGNPMNRGTWCAIVHGVVKSRTPLSN